MKFSSSLKVGILTITALLILIFTVMWIKGKAISSADRITVTFKDVNGMRAGSAVQMMGVRIGQVEEITPLIDVAESKVKVKFVITEPGIEIPKASEVSIQQSGLIGELFLEITPPKERTIYVPDSDKTLLLHPDDAIQMELDDKYYDVGIVKKVEIVQRSMLPVLDRENVKTKNAYKVKYIVNLPGLVMPDQVLGKIVKEDDNCKLRITPKGELELPYPKTDFPYTVIEPMRMSDFMALQYRSAEALIETNERLSLLLSDDLIRDLQKTAVNVEDLSRNAGVTMAKAQELIDLSKSEIEKISKDADELSGKVMVLVDNVNKIAGDKEFVADVQNTAKSVARLSNNVSGLLEDKRTKDIIKDINITAKNVAELSSYVNDMSKDTKLKQSLKETVDKLNCATDKLIITLDTVNYAIEDEEQLKNTVDDISKTSSNMRKFSDKLNKRFLIFRLLF